ncbi:unnamed protein product [Cuscuta epithymum]|nr:unnamed protein product [Cuscuta epithymum]
MASPSKFSPLLFFHRLDNFTSMRCSSYSGISSLFRRNSRMFSSGPFSGGEEDASSQPGDSPSKLVLYSYWQSSCSWRVRFALDLKGLSYEYRAVNLSKREQFDPKFEKLNPLRYVPVLLDSGHTVISDSYAILLYLEEKYPKCQLLPLSPQLRAINLQVASIVSSSIQPLHMISLLNYIEERFGPDERESWAQHNIGKGFYGRHHNGQPLRSC